MIQPGQTVTLHYYRLSESGVQAVLALREAPAAEAKWFQVNMTAPATAVVARATLPPGAITKFVIPGFKS
jgi:hypothetical protein